MSGCVNLNDCIDTSLSVSAAADERITWVTGTRVRVGVRSKATDGTGLDCDLDWDPLRLRIGRSA